MEQMSSNSNNEVQNKEQEQKHEKLQKRLLAAGVAGAVALIGFTVFKGPREFVGGVVNRVSWFFQGRDENGIPKKGYYSTWSRKDLEGNGLRAYNPNTDKDKFDKNGFERELNMPENYVSNSRIVVETSAEKGQFGPILKNGVVDSDVDEAAMKAAYVSYCKAGQEYGSPEVSRSFNEHEGATKRQKTFLTDAASRFDGQYDALCDVEQKTPIEPDLLLVKYFQNISRSDGSSLYVDKNGNPVTLNESAHRDSLISVARYMLYKQGFSKVQVTPGGVIGTSMVLSNRDDNGNYWTGAITEIVVPSKTDPNKFDVYSDYIYLPYYFRFYGRLLSFNEDDGNKMISIGGEMLIEHTNMLRDKNKHLMPFRIVAHNVERPLSDEHKMTGPDYKSELDHIADKFKG
ncbi:hypothetical protein ACMZ7D_04785 [Gardnerella vaginalis]|uniref:Uncharacterized protein n=1 Tax=Gardnerella vaginalis TaxID=2702 RepID=A0A2K1SWL5_GARVA|nr:hypothetical protein [Gardnerella vaginalis]PNS43940.1 hypothetical protein BFS05_01685 [Gardnerella vaginalis]